MANDAAARWGNRQASSRLNDGGYFGRGAAGKSLAQREAALDAARSGKPSGKTYMETISDRPVKKPFAGQNDGT